MKKIYITENQENFLIKEFIQNGFSLAKLDSLNDLSQQRSYCYKFLGYEIGKGSSRVVFEIGDNEIIKLALSHNANIGIFQNKREYENYQITRQNSSINLLFPKVFQIAENGFWMTCERVLPIEKEDFDAILGIPYNTKREIDLDYQKYSVDEYEDEFGLELSVAEFIDWVEHTDEFDDDDKRKYQHLMKTNNWFKLLYLYIKKNRNKSTDLNLDNFGIAMRNGEPTIVILDNGFDKLTENNHPKSIKENVENEYLDKYYGSPLKKYLKMDDDEKAYEMIWSFPHLAYDFLENNFDENDLEDDIDECDGDAIYSFISERLGNEGLEECLSFIHDKIWRTNEPTITCDVMDYTKDIHNQWLIHFSNNADLIAKEGFQYATDELNSLGYSNAGQTKGKTDEGWDFAYLASRVPIDGDKFGKEAVIFRASGIEAWHSGDDERQVMFWNKDAKDIIYIKNGDSNYCYATNSRGDYVCKWYITSTITGDVIYDNEDIREVVKWVRNNFEQYRRHLISKKASKIRNNSLSKSMHNYGYKIK